MKKSEIVDHGRAECRLLVTKTSCDQCTHTRICAIKDSFIKEVTRLAAVDVSENKDFNLEFNCRHFQMAYTVVRSPDEHHGVGQTRG